MEIDWSKVDGFILNGYLATYEHQGVIRWTKSGKDISVHATPWYSTTDKIEVQVDSRDGSENFYNYFIPFTQEETEHKTIQKYINLMEIELHSEPLEKIK